jgi:hypothetical protein
VYPIDIRVANYARAGVVAEEPATRDLSPAPSARCCFGEQPPRRAGAPTGAAPRSVPTAPARSGGTPTAPVSHRAAAPTAATTRRLAAGWAGARVRPAGSGASTFGASPSAGPPTAAILLPVPADHDMVPLTFVYFAEAAPSTRALGAPGLRRNRKGGLLSWP